MPGQHTMGAGDWSVLEALSEAVYIVDADGRIQFCNPDLERLTGYAADTLLGQPSLDLYAPEDQPAVLDRRTRAFRGEPGPSLLEATLVRHDGTRLPVELSLSSLAREGRVVGLLTMVRDISACRRVLSALRAGEERFRLLVEGVQEYAIYLLDPEGHVTTWNTGVERIKGYTAPYILGQPYRCFFPPEEQARGTPARLLAQAARDGHYVGEGWRVRKDGSRFWASVVITALRDAHGELRGFAKVTRDITERREAEQALAHASQVLEQRVAERTAALQTLNIRLEASLQEKEVLLKEIHHRVKNNLQVITSLLSLQHEAIDDPQARALFAESERRIGSMALVHETLYQTGDLGRFNLAQYIPTLSAQLLHAYGVEPQRVAVHLDLAEVTLPLEMAIPCGLILHELLSNGLQHAFPDEQTGTITVTLTHAADRVSLRVQDNGCGVPAFLDVHHTESLGLQLVGALAEQLAGTVTLERTEGTVFTVTFPLPNDLEGGEFSAGSPSGGGLRG